MNKKFLLTNQVLKESGWTEQRLVDISILHKNLVIRWNDGGFQYATPSSVPILQNFLGLKIGNQHFIRERQFVPVDFSLDYIIQSYDCQTWLFYEQQLKDYLYPIAFQEGKGVELTIVSGITGKLYGICGISGDVFYLGNDIFHALGLIINNENMSKIYMRESDVEVERINLIFEAIKLHLTDSNLG